MILPPGAYHAILESAGKEVAKLVLEGSPHPAIIVFNGSCFLFYRRKRFTEFHYKAVSFLVLAAEPTKPLTIVH